MIWKKLKKSARPTFKNPDFQSLCELGKTWKYNLRPTFRNPNLQFIDELEKVMSQCKFHC